MVIYVDIVKNNILKKLSKDRIKELKRKRRCRIIKKRYYYRKGIIFFKI